ncbi:MAG: FAD-dependent oxidoreductase [Phycisphaerae bacterium]
MRLLAIIPLLASLCGCAAERRFDVVIYGGTSAGVIAAAKIASLGKSVVLIEPGHHLGGLSAGGLGATDIGNKAAIGGMARDFYCRVGSKYGQAEAWTFEPHVAESVFGEIIGAAGITVVMGERLDRDARLKMHGTRVASIMMISGRRYSGRIYLDCSYEGDLMAAAGVSHTIGRESNATHGETLNGVQVANATKHQFSVPVSAYRIAGDPTSGLLPGIEAAPPEADGSGDHRVQAYNFRMCLTDVASNRRAWEKPADYDESRYELLLRNFEAGDARLPIHSVMMPKRKTDTNNNGAFSTDFIGANYSYAAASDADRLKIIAAHLSYQKGLMWTLAEHPRVPAKIREHFQNWGPARDEFVEHDNWPHQLYVREARRMVSDYVMTQDNCQGRRRADDPVGLAAYTMDSHNVRRYVDAAGNVRNEGDVQVGGFPPYEISYRAIVPRRTECTNLLVPVCLSASHIAYGSIRMEPVFMVLAESAATAACMAIDGDLDVQAVDQHALGGALQQAGQVLTWPAQSKE